jgi:uncharacterized protein
LILYLDTSALVKVYVEEIASDRVRAEAAKAKILVTSVIAYTEARSAFARRCRYDHLSAQELLRVKSQFEEHWPELETVTVDELRSRRAGELAEAYQLKGFDAVHLASAEYFQTNLGRITFACFDGELSRAASSCGMSLLLS